MVADLQERFGFNADNPAHMHAHTWLWVRDRITALLCTPPGAALPREGKDTLLIPSTRIQWALFNPDRDD